MARPGGSAAFQDFLQMLLQEHQKEIARRLRQAGIYGGTIDASNITGNMSSTVQVPQAGSQVMEAIEAVTAGAIVNVGSTGVRLADAALWRPAQGFALDAITLGENGQINGVGLITGLSSLTLGATQYLSTSGTTTETPPSASGAMFQIVGVALSETRMLFHPQPPIIL